jgi:pimeloyl-ACP methyl ester carboxylesterase
MGGWIALHMALQRPERVAGLVLIAPAVDITARFWHQLGPQKQATLCAGSSVSLGSSFITDGSDALTIRFFEQGAQHFLFKNTEWDPSRSSSGSSEGDPAAGGSGAGKQLKEQAGSRPGDAGAADGGRKLDGIQFPVIILHGVLDDVVPVQVSRQLVQELPAAACVQLHEVLEGDHRLSRQEDLQLLTAAVSELLQACA